jgi:hypothetical protein
MATIGKWYSRRLITPAKIGGVLAGASLDGGPLWIPELKRYVCMWYTGTTVSIRYLGDSADLYTADVVGDSFSYRAGSFYYDGNIYVINSDATHIYVAKVDVSTWASTNVVTIAKTSGYSFSCAIFFDGTATLVCTYMKYSAPYSYLFVDTSGIATPDTRTNLYTGTSAWISAQEVLPCGVDNTYFYFIRDGSRYRVALAGGTPATTTWLMFGRPGYHTKGSTVLFDKTEANSWDLAHVPSSLVVIAESTPRFIFLSGTTIYFMDGTTEKATLAASTTSRFKDNLRDSYARSDAALEGSATGLVCLYGSVMSELASLGKDVI